jgi:hypothetical protein
MALLTRQKEKALASPDEIRAELAATVQAFNDEPAYIAAQKRLEEANGALPRATAYLEACRARRARARVVIGAPDLLERIALVEERIASLESEIGRASTLQPGGVLPSPRTRLLEQRAQAQHDLGALQEQVADAPPPTQFEFDHATPEARREFREAEAAFLEATKPFPALRQAITDAQFDVTRARKAAAASVQARLLKIYAAAVRLQEAAGLAMQEANQTTYTVARRINGLSGPESMSTVVDLSFALFRPADGGDGPSAFDAWRSTLRLHVPDYDDAKQR